MSDFDGNGPIKVKTGHSRWGRNIRCCWAYQQLFFLFYQFFVDFASVSRHLQPHSSLCVPFIWVIPKNDSKNRVESCQLAYKPLTIIMTVTSIVVYGVWCILVTSITSFRPQPFTYRPRTFVLRSFLRMDDEVARPNIKEELTTRDEYLDTKFKRLSSSGHDLTPIDTVDWIMLILSGANLDFLGVSSRPSPT